MNNSEKSLPLVSILIPTCNRPKFLIEALDSALQQTYANIEIVICDDSINDETEQLITTQYLPRYKQIRYFHNEKNLGQFDNDLKLMSMARGEFINFLMDEDLFAPRKIETMMQYFLNDVKEEIGLVTSHRMQIDEHGQHQGVFLQTDKRFEKTTIFDGIEVGNIMLMNNYNLIGEPTTVLFRKSKLQVPFGTFNGRKYQCNVDKAAWYEILHHSKAVFVNEILSYFRWHSGQQTHSPKILLSSATDFAHEVLTCRSKGFLLADRDYSLALQNCINHQKAMLSRIDLSKLNEAEHHVMQEFWEYWEKTKIAQASDKQRTSTLTIGMPVYNGEKYLETAINSLLAQEFSDFRMIICDDQSTDRTASICEKYSQIDHRVTYVRNKERLGGARNFNQVFSLSTSKFFMWAAQDDEWEKDYIRKCMQKLEQYPQAGLCVTEMVFMDEEGHDRNIPYTNIETINRNIQDSLQAFLTLRGWYALYGIMRSDIMRTTKLYQPVYGGDVLFQMEMLLTADIIKVNEPLFKYRVENRFKNSEENMRAIDHTQKYPPSYGYYSELARNLVAIIKASRLAQEDKIGALNKFAHIVAMSQGLWVNLWRENLINVSKLMLTQKIEDVLSKPVVKDNQAELFRTAYQAIRGKQIDLSALHSQKVFAIVAHDAESQLEVLKSEIEKGGYHIQLGVIPIEKLMDEHVLAQCIKQNNQHNVQECMIITRQESLLSNVAVLDGARKCNFMHCYVYDGQSRLSKINTEACQHAITFIKSWSEWHWSQIGASSDE